MRRVERVRLGAACASGAFLLAGLLDLLFARTALSGIADRLLFSGATLLLLASSGAAIGLLLAIGWPWLGRPAGLALGTAIVTYPLGRALFSGAWISRRVAPSLGGLAIACLLALAMVAAARRIRPHWSWALWGVGLYLVDAWAWRPLYPAAHVIVALAYGCCFALSLAPLAQRLRLPPGHWLLWATCALAGISGSLLLASKHNAIRFALLERTNAARKIAQPLMAVFPPAYEENEPRFLHQAFASSQSTAQPAAFDRTGSDTKTLLAGANVVLVTVDALRADRMRALRHGQPLMPNLQRLAQRAVVFETAYTQAPHSAFSLASLMTSDYVHATSALRQTRNPSLAEILRASGYRTTAIYSEGVFFTGHEKLDAFAHSHFGFDNARTGERDAEETTVEALDAIEDARQQDSPLFLWVHYFDPHEPYQARPRFNFGSRPLDLYDAEVATVDAALPRLFQGLETLSRPTILVVTADHGEEFGEHGGVYHGSSLYEEQVRVPLVVAAQGLTARHITSTVELVDVAPTLLRLLGVTVPTSMLGDDLGDALIGHAFEMPAFSEVDTKKMVAIAQTKLIYDYRRHTWELYDLAADAVERSNRFDDDPARAATLKQELFAWLDRIEAAIAAEGRKRPAGLDLGRMGDLRAVPALAALVQSPRAAAEDRIEAARLLSKLQDRAALPALWDATRRSDGTLREEALIALGELFDKRAREPLAALLGVSDGEINTRAAIALAKLGDPRAASVLAASLNATDSELRLRSARYLGWVGRRSEVEPLLRAASDMRLRLQAVLALGRIGGRASDERILPFLLERMQRDDYADVQNYSAVALGYLGDARALEPLVLRVRSGDVRWAPETLVRLGALEKGILGGADVGPAETARLRGVVHCTEKRTHDVEDYLGATSCQAGEHVVIHARALASGRRPSALLLRARAIGSGVVDAVVSVTIGGRPVGTATLVPSWTEATLAWPDDLNGSPAEVVLTPMPKTQRFELDHVLYLP